MPFGMGAGESPPSTSAIRVRSDSLPGLHQRTLIRPARFGRSSQSVDCLAASARCRAGVARPPAPSVLVVPPDFDGLLRASPCGLVASRSRPWGSSRFRIPVADREWNMGISHATRGASARDPFPGTHDPSKPFPCTQPSDRQRATEIAAHLSLTPASPTLLLPLEGPDHSGPPRLASGPFTARLPLSPLPLRLRSAASVCSISACQSLFRDSFKCRWDADLRSAAWRSRSTSGSCSAYRSVAPAWRFRRAGARCFHGLCALHTAFPRTRSPPRREKVDRLQRFCCVASVVNRSHPGPT
jgi:hypothetical protein